MREWLNQLRANEGLTMKELADKIHVSETYICNIENGKRAAKGLRMDTILRIAEAVGVDPMALLRKEVEYISR